MTEEPRPQVQLTGEDGNAAVIIGRTIRALERAGCSPAHVKRFKEEATSGDYDNVLRTVMRYAETE